MKIADDCEFLFTHPRAVKWLKRPRLPRSLGEEITGNALFPLTLRTDVRPGHEFFSYAMDISMLHAKEELTQRLNDEFPATVTSEGFAGPNGVPSDFNNLHNVSGYGMDPLPIPVSDNATLIEKNGLIANIRPQDVSWLKELIRLFFGSAVPADLHIRKAASTGFPYFTNENPYKKQMTYKIIENADHFLKLVTGGPSDLKECLSLYHVVLAASINERQQPNAILYKDGKWSSKGRTAPTEQEAREGSYAGETIADMTVKREDGTVVANHFGMRRRDVFGNCGPVNYFLTAMVGCNREVYLTRFEFTYKTRDRLDKERKLARYTHVVGSDVKTMDKMIPRWFTEFLFNELALYWDERVVELARRMYMSPYVVPPPWRDTPESYNPVFGGSPLDPKNFKQHVGLPSGIAINPDVGKLWMSFVYVVLYRDVGALFSPSQLEAFLQGRNPDHGLLDMSDDATFLTNSSSVAKRLMSAKSPYVVLEPEQPVIYLGDVFTMAEGQRRAYPNPVTYVVNALCREDSVDRVDYETGKIDVVGWAEGVLARYQTYSTSPIFRDLNQIYEEVMMKHVGVSPITIARGLAKMQRFTDIDAMVRADPNVLYYKIDPKDVSPELLDDLVATVPAQDIWPHIKHLFKTNTR